jgi:hypothetical protein
LGNVVGSLDLPYELPDRPEQAGDRRADRLGAKPDPDERGRVYEAMRAHVETEDSGLAQETRLPLDDAERGGYWAEVPRLVEMWAGHEERWPADGRPQAAAERSADPAADAIGQLREGEPAISADVRTAERENSCGGRLGGFEFRLKDEDRLKEKAVEGLAISTPDATPAQVLRLIPDAIRYTFCFPQETYTRGYYDIKERLQNRGHEMYSSKNSWDSPEYKGINTRWVTPQGQRFEVQFHTPESFHTKQDLTHSSYERIRNPLTSKRELGELHSFQREVSSRLQIPDGATNIPDYKKEGF